MNWDEAEEYLATCERAYAEIGTSGIFALRFTIMPQRDRFNKGERSQELYSEIMNIDL